MSLRAFHGVFIVLSLMMLAFVGRWASGANAAGLVTPWALYGSVLAAALMLPYLYWYATKVRLPR